jgi:hypothetical protein
MTSSEKSLNYKVVDLVESYKFRIKFIFIRVYTKKLHFFENRLTLTAMDHGGCRSIGRGGLSIVAPATLAHDSLPLPLWVRCV